MDINKIDKEKQSEIVLLNLQIEELEFERSQRRKEITGINNAIKAKRKHIREIFENVNQGELFI